VGRLLTENRLEWLRQRTEVVFYTTGEPNRASQDLHAPFGFVEVDRGFPTPHGVFPNERNILFKLTL